MRGPRQVRKEVLALVISPPAPLCNAQLSPHFSFSEHFGWGPGGCQERSPHLRSRYLQLLHVREHQEAGGRLSQHGADLPLALTGTKQRETEQHRKNTAGRPGSGLGRPSRSQSWAPQPLSREGTRESGRACRAGREGPPGQDQKAAPWARPGDASRWVPPWP